jgi:hypothetical protein
MPRRRKTQRPLPRLQPGGPAPAEPPKVVIEAKEIPGIAGLSISLFRVPGAKTRKTRVEWKEEGAGGDDKGSGASP